MNTAEEQAIIEAAIKFAKSNRTRISNELTNLSEYPAVDNPTAVFMAGAPGAGKTEVSQALVSQFEHTLRIDADEYRRFLPGYNGGNSHLFQRAVSLIVERVLDKVFKRKQNFVLDGTFSNVNVARRNIERALGHGHSVELLYVFQNPVVSWAFVGAREEQEGRRILLDTFIEQFLNSKEVVNEIKNEFGDSINVTLLIKNLDMDSAEYINVERCIDDHIRWDYNAPQLRTDLLRAY